MSKPPFDQHLIEEADTGICMDGWDNFLFETAELQEYLTALKYLKAIQTAAVVQELLDLVATESHENPIDLTESHKDRLDELWRRYSAASEAENPQELAKSVFKSE